jgi:hypothetical protein
MCSFLRRGVDLWCDDGCMEDEHTQTSRCVLPSMVASEVEIMFSGSGGSFMVVPASLNL